MTVNDNPNDSPASRVYSWRFPVRTYELDSMGQVKLPCYLNYMEEGATQASAAAGYDMNWYRENQRRWVVRTQTLRYYAPSTYGDELELHTWISDLRRVQSHREHDLRRVGDGAAILRGRTNWVYLDAATLRPTRVPDEFAAIVIPGLDDLDTQIHDPIAVEDPVIHTEERHVEYSEVDTVGHVNNACYLTWIEESLRNALQTAGWPPDRFAQDEVTMYPLAHEIEYIRSAVADDPIWIVTRLAEIGYDRAAWHNEIRHGATGELMAKAVAVRAFVDAAGPRSIPDALELALTREPNKES